MGDLLEGWEDRSAETSQLVNEREIRHVIRCNACSFDPLALVPLPFLPRAADVAARHNEEQPGHNARVLPRRR